MGKAPMSQANLLMKARRMYMGNGPSRRLTTLPDRILAASREHKSEEVIDQYYAWRKNAKVLQMQTPPMGRVVYNTVLTACERLSFWSRALAVLRDMTLIGSLQQPRHSRTLPDAMSYNATLGACATAHQWEATLDLFLEMQQFLSPDAISYSAVIESCVKARKHGMAQLFSKWSQPCLDTSLSKIQADKTSLRYRYVVLSTLVRRQLWAEAVCLLWRSVQLGRPLDTDLLNLGISAYHRGQKTGVALKLLREAGSVLGGIQLPPANLDTFKLAILSLPSRSPFLTLQAFPADSMNGPGWQVALEILETASCSRLQPDMQLFNCVAGACSRAYSWHAALGVLKASRHHCLKWDIFAYRAVLHASARHSTGSDVNIRALWRQLHKQKLQPDSITFGAAIGLCERSHRWVESLDLLNCMPCPNAVSLTSVIAACAAGSAWAVAVHLFWDMPSRWGFRPHAANMVNVLHALGKGFHWQEACNLLFELEWADENIVSWQHYFAAADACGQAGRWQEALNLLFERMPQDVGPPPSYRFSAAISACKNALVFASTRGTSAAELRSASIWESALALFASGLETTDGQV